MLMTIKQVTKDVAVAAQLTTADVAELAARGFKSIICNRPDGEAPDQTVYAEIAKAASAAGLEARFVPVASGMMTSADVAKFAAAVSELPKPILAYCRSGTRSSNVCLAAQALTGGAEK